MDDAVAVVLIAAVSAYAVLAGADFGAGFWDLVAGGADRGERPRALIVEDESLVLLELANILADLGRDVV